MLPNFSCTHCKDALPTAPKQDRIIVHGAKEHNLKNICFEIPKGKLVALTGPSGSGKSSLATDILQKECVRQFLESLGMTTDHLEKAKVDKIMGLSPSIGVSQRAAEFNPRSTVGTKTGILTILRTMFAALGQQPCAGCGALVKQPLQDKENLHTIEVEEGNADSLKKRKISYFNCPHCSHQLEKLQMAHFSNNTIAGACSTCKGIGKTLAINLTALLDEERTLQDGAVRLWDAATATYYQNAILASSKHYNFTFDPTLPLKNYTTEQKNFLLYGISFPDFAKANKDIKAPKKVSDGNFEGVATALLNMHKKNPETTSAESKQFIMHAPCIACASTGLSALGRTATVDKKTITTVTNLSLNELLAWIENLDTTITHDVVPIFTAFKSALTERTANIVEVGLEYLTLDRMLPSLSGGELQRVKLASLLGSGLTGMLYVFDEPTTGLHPHDTAKLLATIRKLQEAGNTVLIIEHDTEVIKHADYIIDMGPGGGTNGGEIVITGTPADVRACAASSTGSYLAKQVVIKEYVRARDYGALTIRGASAYNLKNIDVSIPLKQFVVLTGVSGSGKSTFLFDIIDKVVRKHLNRASELPGKHTAVEGLEHVNRVITVDQVAIGNTKSSRSNIATYSKLFDAIRDLFAALPTAKSRGFDAQAFSFNTSNERCGNCNGAGVVAIDMAFMPDIEAECPACNGMRFSARLLEVQFQGYHVAQILGMTICQALVLFRHEKKIFALLDIMRRVSLEHLKLGQSTSTLSGGEAQRLKLSAELAKAESGNTLYLLDEPTTGLHPQEVEKLLGILQELVLKGNTVVIIEHKLEAICQADTIIDFGPGGGKAGGNIVAMGTVQAVMAQQDSLTGQALKVYLNE
ncbi:MAG: ATP-binding cassette domain-containing protein [Candidatus Babeliales bacterium]